MTRKERTVGYVRVSTDRQAEEGLGLEVQERAIRAWARSTGVRLVTIVRDAGVSGAKELDDRPGLLEALQGIRAGHYDSLVVYRLDRLARDLVLQEQLLAEIRRLGGAAHSTSEAESGFLSDDPDDPSRRFIRQVLGAVGEYERSMIALRLRSGRKRKAEAGGFAYGSPPFGYRADSRTLKPDGEEQRTIERIKALKAEGASYRTIAVTITDEGHVPKRSDRWHPEMIRRVLSRA